MATRKLVACGKCVYWRNPDSSIIVGGERPITSATLGDCRRRLQTGRKTEEPYQPVTPSSAACSEGVVLPVPPRLPKNCAECRFWVKQGPKEGWCQVWAPSWQGRNAEDAKLNRRVAQFQFPTTPPDFMCGDGVSVHFVDPDDLPD